MNKAKITIMVALVLFLLNSPKASATLFPDLGEAVNNMTRAAAEAARQVQCQNIQQKAGLKKRYINGIFRSRMDNYTAINSKLARIINETKDKGYDTEDLETDAEIMHTAIQNFHTSGNGVFLRLAAIEEHGCDSSINYLRAMLGQARGLLRQTRDLDKEIKDFYTVRIKRDLERMSQQRYRETND